MPGMTETSVMTATGSDAHADRVIGRYRLIEVIGEGGMGRVWLAEDELLWRKVAVKEIAAPADGLPDDRTMGEARAAARLHHPNVVKIFDVVWWSGRSWIVMEYVESRSLHEVVAEDGPRTHREAARIGLQMLAALAAAHAAGVLHRDVKPHNVLIDPGGRVVLTDFGLAATDGTDFAAEPLVGSPFFIAPERLQRVPTGPAADLWSLGATLYAATEGRPPFARDSIPGSLVAATSDEPDAPRRPGPLTPVILDMLAKDPAARPSAAGLETRLRRIAENTVGIARPAAARVPATPGFGTPPAGPGTGGGAARGVSAPPAGPDTGGGAARGVSAPPAPPAPPGIGGGPVAGGWRGQARVPAPAPAADPALEEIVLAPMTVADRRTPWLAGLALLGAVLFLIGLTGTAIWS